MVITTYRFIYKRISSITLKIFFTIFFFIYYAASAKNGYFMANEERSDVGVKTNPCLYGYHYVYFVFSMMNWREKLILTLQASNE